MKKYEISFIISPELEGESLEKLVKSFEDMLTNKGAKIEKKDELGLRDLAYEIDDFKKGNYFIYQIESNHEINQEFDRLARINENVIRHIVLSI